MKRLFFIILIILYGFSCTGKKTEDEPGNNKRENAEEIKSGQVIKGTYFSKSGKDIDYMFIRTDSPLMMQGKLSGVKGVDAIIYLYRKGDKKPFKVINDTLSSLGEVFGPLYIDRPGVVIAIRPSKNVNREEYEDLSYEFSVSTFSAMSFSEIEPNDDFKHAQNLTNSINGYYSNVYINATDNLKRDIESDYFYINLDEEKKYRLSVELSDVGGVDPVLRVYNSSYEKILTVDEKGVSQGETVKSFGVEGPGKVYFSVTAKDYKINEKEYYELEVETKEYENKYEFEPNDTIEKASNIKEEITYGEFTQKEDIDYYEIQNQLEYPVVFSSVITPSRSGNIEVVLYDQKQKEQATFNDGKNEDLESIANRVIPAKSSYFMKVTLSSDSSFDETVPYTIRKKMSSLSDIYETEPNDTKNSANDFLPESNMIGYINPNSDIDYYKVKLDKQKKMRIMADGIDGCELNLRTTDGAGYVTDKAVSKNMSSGVTLVSILEPNSLVLLSCQKSEKNLYKIPYKLTLQSLE